MGRLIRHVKPGVVVFHENLPATVVVATFGADWYRQLADERAVPSAITLGLAVVQVHVDDGDLADARNLGAAEVETPWTIFLDADDELEGGFAVYTGRAARAHPDADVLVPQVRYIHPSGGTGTAHFPRVAGHVDTDHECGIDCLPHGNWIVVGAPVRTSIVQTVSWEPWDIYEDFAWWVACWQAGAKFIRVPDAIYRAHVRVASRNQRERPNAGLETHRAIARKYGLPVP